MDSSSWDQRYSASDLVWSATPNQWVTEVASDLPAGRVLDLAGGEGRNALWLAEQGWQALVVDFSAVALERAQALAGQRLGPDADQRLATLRADLETFTPVPEAFDLVLVVYLQVPPQTRGPILRAAASAVAPGGRLLVVAHHTKNLTEGVGGPQDRSRLYTEADVTDDIADSGLVIERAETVLREVTTDNGPAHAIDTLVLARNPTDPRTPTTEETQP